MKTFYYQLIGQDAPITGIEEIPATSFEAATKIVSDIAIITSAVHYILSYRKSCKKFISIDIQTEKCV